MKSCRQPGAEKSAGGSRHDRAPIVSYRPPVLTAAWDAISSCTSRTTTSTKSLRRSTRVVNHGNLCVKGRFGYDFIYNKDRVTTPLIRKEAQAPGARTQAFDRDQWREVSWDEALDYTADRMVEIYQRDGADAMAVYCCAKATNEDNYLLQKLFRALVSQQ